MKLAKEAGCECLGGDAGALGCKGRRSSERLVKMLVRAAMGTPNARARAVFYLSVNWNLCLLACFCDYYDVCGVAKGD